MRDRRWRRPWQVVRFFPNGAVIVRCSHQRAVTAGWCSTWRAVLRPWWSRRPGAYHDVRRNPYFEEVR